MCGIWGVFPNDTKGFYLADVPIVKQLMTVTSLRGDDSTGIALVSDPATKARVWKGLGGPSYIINGDAWEKISEFMTKKAKVVFGHGRSATKGSITAKNAHPFTHEHITLVHNGTIHFGLDGELKEADTEVDSHALAVAIANKGLVDALYDISGAYALIVQDTKEGCIYVVRNDERPLSRLVLHDKHIIMSESEALKYLAGRGNLGVVGMPKIEYFPKHVIFKYDVKTATWTKDETLKEKQEKKYLPTTAVWPPSTPSGGQTNYYGSSNKYTGKWGTGGTPGTREYDSYQIIELLCTEVTVQPQGHSYKYKFVDDDQREFVGISSYNEKDKEGKLCRTNRHTVLTVKATGEVTRFLKYRELEWFDEEKKEFLPSRLKTVEEQSLPEQSPPEEAPLTHVITYNKRLLKMERWKQIVSKTDCSICQGPVLEHEHENTYVTEGDGVICSDCISKKKHHSYGYGQ